jgi:trans-aconitate methyltransferase
MAYEFDGQKYQAASSHQKAWGRKLIEELRLAGNESILDLGCGDGTLTRHLAELVPKGQVVGIDSSLGMLEQARQNVLPNLSFRHLDINQLDYQKAFDIIFSNAALHWVLDHEKLLRNVQKALKPRAKARFNFAGWGNCANFYAVVKELMQWIEFKKYFSGFVWPWYMPALAEYEALVSKTGFAEFRVWEENADKYFQDEKALIAWIDQPSIVPFLMKIDDRKDKELFRKLVIDRMLQATRRTNGTYFETFRRINLVAIKSES